VWTVSELASEWKTTPKHIRQLIHGGQLPAFSLSKSSLTRAIWRIRNKAVKDYQNAGREVE
jgi:hypothetical protein